MADVKKCFAPSDKSITKVIKSCKEGFAVYPVRLALTTETLKSTSQSTDALEMPPQTIAKAEKSKQYDLRRLRDGFIYILATRVQGMMTAHAPNNKAWYVYCYRSPDVDAKSENNLPMDYHFNQYKCGELNVYKDWKLECNPKPFIHLPEQIHNIEILYSDYKLPPEFLDKLATDEKTRKHWMRTANIAEPEGAAAPITELKNLVKDFSTSVDVVNEPSKTLRFTPIGFRKKCDNIANQIIFHKKGAVIALDDPIGTARDLSAYHRHLEEERQIKLKKYEYAITTAQFIDAYAKQVYTKKWDNWKGILDAANQPLKEFSRTNMLPPVGPQMSPERIKKREPTLEKIYLKDVKGIAPQHLDKSNKADDNIIKALKKEFELDDIPGLNTVHKMANLSGLHGKSFLNIATVHARFAESNIQRLKDLSDLIEKLSNSEKVGSSANGFLHHFHGLIWGLNQTTYGRKGLLLSLDPKTELVSKEDKTLLKQMIDSLSGVVKTFTSVSGILAGASNLAALNLYSYDLVIELLVTEITSIPLKRKAGKTLVWEETEVVEHIRETYRTKGIEENKEYIEEILSHNENTKTHKVRGRPHYERAKFYKKAPKKEMHSKTTVEIDRQLVINDDYYHLFRNTSEKLTGAAMYFGLAGSFMSFFGENTAKTRAGKIANDPILNTMVSVADIVKPADKVSLVIMEDTGKLKMINTITKEPFPSKWAAAKASLVSFSTLITGIGVAFELMNMKEASYTGDDWAFWGSASRAFGMVLMTNYASTAISSALATIGITASAMFVTGLGLIFLVAGFICLFFIKDDMEEWIEYGFWGKSEEYWGTAENQYDWSGERKIDHFKTEFFDKSEFNYIQGTNQLTPQSNISYKYYKIEIERFFAFNDKPRLTKVDYNTLRIQYRGLVDEAMLAQIKIEKLSFQIAGSRLTTYEVTQQAQQKDVVTRKLLSAEQGIATLQWDKNITWQGHYYEYVLDKDDLDPKPTRKQKLKRFNNRQIKNIKATIAIPRYKDAKEYIEATLAFSDD